ncbi:MAG: leucine-rich repeat domain-containing protein [Lachnospiraceae bacterium]|nr:leucine-rich repeat domain-containing protein [Lachnospiraceae bacterium]
MNGILCAEVTGSEGPVTVLEVPERAGGLPVASVGHRAFAERGDFREVRLPDSVHTLQSFAFYHCTALRRVCLSDSLEDVHDGAFRRCEQLSLVEASIRGGCFAVLRDILGDSDGGLTLRLHLPDGEACLVFPPYVITASDNTMARTIQFDISGSGYGYRESVSARAVDWRGYDAMFRKAVIDSIGIAGDIALGRLMFPYALGAAPEETYLRFLREHAGELLPALVKRGMADRDREGDFSCRERIRYLCGAAVIPQEALPAALEAAAAGKDAALTALLMEYAGHRQTGDAAAASHRLSL